MKFLWKLSWRPSEFVLLTEETLYELNTIYRSIIMVTSTTLTRCVATSGIEFRIYSNGTNFGKHLRKWHSNLKRSQDKRADTRYSNGLGPYP